MAASYQASDIVVLEGLDAVRRRPAMYIGGTDTTGLHHLLWEIVDNAVDEAMEGHAKRVDVALEQDGRTVTVVDDGRGIPVDKHPKYKKSALELVMTTLHAGGKFDKRSYGTSTGLHGVGASVVNALSERLDAEVRRDGRIYRQSYERGRPLGSVKKAGSSRRSGTTITFAPDSEVFGKARFDPEVIRQALEDRAYLFSQLTIHFDDRVNGKVHKIQHSDGIAAFLDHLVDYRKLKRVAPPLHIERGDGIRIEVALAWTEATAETIRSYANGVRTIHGGTHESGLRAAVAKALRNYMTVHEWKPKGVTIGNEDIREGLVSVLSVFLAEPQFQGQTKARLNNSEMTAAVDGALRPALEQWLNENPSHAEAILGRIQLASKARAASRQAARDVRGKSAVARRLNLPGKLADCSSSDPRKTELFIVEGDSAGGSAKQGRNRKHQAILPLRGKVLNTQQASKAKVAQNKELSDLVRALGCGMGSDGFDPAKLRYHKVILLMDADSDGNHIATLLLTFFYNHIPQLIEGGYVYIAQPPLYRVDVGDKTFWALDDLERDEVLSSLRKGAKSSVQRFKGLGEMPPSTLKETTLDPARRTLLQVQIEDRDETDRTMSELMGSDPAPRFKFLIEQSSQAVADELDV